MIYGPSYIAGDGRDAPQIDSVICFDAAITRRAGIGPGERLERHFHSLISRRPGSSDRENLSWSERRVRQMRKVSVRRSEEHTSELQSLMSISYAVFCLKKKNTHIY